MGFADRLKHAWNAFANKDPTDDYRDYSSGVYVSSTRPDRMHFTRGNERTIATAVYTRIAMDCAQIDIKHIRVDDNGRYKETIDSRLNECFSTEANLDQTGRAFFQDAVMTMFDKGCVAIVPVDTTLDPKISTSYDVNELRTGVITQWYPDKVKLKVYNEKTGNKEEIVMLKKHVAIIENPLYPIINEPNSTMQRLIRKLSLLDVVDERNSSNKLNLIIQLPYLVKSEARRKQANERRKEIESQLVDSPYGIAYTDGTEKVTQLNRALENNLMAQIEYLTNMLYSQLGITVEILNGTANDEVMLNYNNRTIEPIMSAIVLEMRRKFLTKTARTQGQSIAFFRDPFKLVPVRDLAELADKMTRNEIMTSNEFRQIVGLVPSNDPSADQLRNKNLNQSAAELGMEGDPNAMMDPMAGELDETMSDEETQAALDEMDNFDSQLDELEKQLEHGELLHYASPYYDPVKAHEYYMKTRELKGYKGRTKLNEQGKAAKDYVKEQLTEERKAKVEEHRDQTQNAIDANQDATNNQIESIRERKKSAVQQYTSQMQNNIKTLQTQLSNMSKEQKEANREAIQAKIVKLREDNSAKREALASSSQKQSDSLRKDNAAKKKSLREGHTTKKKELKDEYDQKLSAEYEKIHSTAEFIEPEKSKKGKSSGGGSKSSGSSGGGGRKVQTPAKAKAEAKPKQESTRNLPGIRDTRRKKK